MLIITADDYGMTVPATDRILECFRNRRITSASAMVFMADSERAATLARGTDLEIGLHINLDQAFTAPGVDDAMRHQHARVARYLNGHRFAQALFNPLLTSAFRNLVRMQWNEFERLYGRPPDFVNGHHHMHLATNVLAQRLLPAGSKLRRPFTFASGEKGRVNRWYRSLVARHLRKNFITPHSLYSVEPISDVDRLRKITHLSAASTVELEVHPETVAECEFLLSPVFRQLLEGTDVRGFKQLVAKGGAH